jgi:predicted lipoprotein with Yx(FWY)xxD motif
MTTSEGSLMPDPKLPAPRSSGARLNRRAIVGLTAAVAGFGLAALTGLAIAKTFTLKVVANAKVSNISVLHSAVKHEAVAANSHGVTLYILTHDTIAHPGCTKANKCFMFWFPATVPSKSTKLTKPPGVKGTLRTFHRDGFFQLTLNNHPLYTFKLDNKKQGVAVGDGVKSFGGVWHPVPASAKGKTQTTPTTTTMTTTTMPTCLYPPCP